VPRLRAAAAGAAPCSIFETSREDALNEQGAPMIRPRGSARISSHGIVIIVLAVVRPGPRVISLPTAICRSR
jgi:hypothetical protein